jgi:hypothetical protein
MTDTTTCTNTTTNSNNHNNNARTKQEQSIAKSLLKVFQQRQEELKAQFGVTGGMNETEVEILKNLQTVESTYYGLAVSLVTFWILRGIRVKTRRWAAKRAQQDSPATGFSTDGGKTFSPFHNAPPGQTPPPVAVVVPPETPLGRWFGIFLDATVGALVGTMFDEYLVDRKAAKKKFVEMPLQAGRSNMADQFCPVLIQEYQRQWSLGGTNEETTTSNNSDGYTEKGTLGTVSIHPTHQWDPQELLKNPQTEHLQIMTQFIRNCQKRQAMERRIRKERGLDAKEPVEIPPPGVQLDDQSSGSSSEEEEASFRADFYEGEVLDASSSDWSQEDVSSFVADQEDDSKKR